MSIHSILLVRRFFGKTGSNAKLKEKRKKRRGEEKMRNWDSLSGNRSQSGNGLLHLINIAWGELEHRGD